MRNLIRTWARYSLISLSSMEQDVSSRAAPSGTAARAQEPRVGGPGGASARSDSGAGFVVGAVGATVLSWPNVKGPCVGAGAGAAGEAAPPAAVWGCPRKVRTPGW